MPGVTDERFNDIVKEVHGWLHEADPEVREDFLKSTKDELVKYHHGLGTRIRNSCDLWKDAIDDPWEPVIVNDTDYSPDHPDSISMRVIEEVWKRAREGRNDLE